MSRMEHNTKFDERRRAQEQGHEAEPKHSGGNNWDARQNKAHQDLSSGVCVAASTSTKPWLRGLDDRLYVFDRCLLREVELN